MRARLTRLDLIRTVWREFTAREDGAGTIEFALFFPALFTLVFSVFEVGWLASKIMMLDRAVDLTVRDLRIGALPNPTHDGLKALICDRALIFADCFSSLALELTPVSGSFGVGLGGGLAAAPACVDRTQPGIAPVVTINPGSQSQNMMVRACVVVDPLMPGMGVGLRLPKDASGGYRMVSASAFVNEPN